MSELWEQLMEDPNSILDNNFDGLFHLTTEQIHKLQKHWVCKRFNELRPNIAMLDKLAREQSIDAVHEVDDIAPLLFAHTVYKSYPMSYLERNRFDKLTKWLGGLTTTDLSKVDAAGIESIDDWLDLLDANSNLMVFHTTGTTGKLSFLPRTKEQGRTMAKLVALNLRDWHGANSRADILKNHRPVITPGYRYGGGTAGRLGGLQVELFAGGDHNALFLYPDQRLSADLVSLSGRIRSAEAKGELGALQIPPALLLRREEFIEMEKKRPETLAKFLDDARTRFGGQDVYVGAIYALLLDWAEDGRKQGQNAIFGPNSFIATGGGTKGRVFPDNWKEIVLEFLGVKHFDDTYSMTECISMCPRCEHDKYHVNPLIVPFLLDPATGKLLPRKDGTTGRMALFDMLPDSYWAGLVTGDEVTLRGWGTPCACGRTGLYAEPDIRRYSEKESGDDKLLCSGAPEAHDSAAEFLANYAN